VRHEDGTLEELKAFYTEFEDVTVGGAPAIIGPDGGLLYVQTDRGLFAVQVVGTVAEGVDQAAAIVSLAETALPRLAGIPLPTPEPEPTGFPMPSFTPDAELEALFPAQLGGEDLEIQSLSGRDLEALGSDPEQVARVEETLAGYGRSLDDVSLAFGFAPGAQLSAIRIRGVDAREILDSFLPLLLTEADDPVQEPMEIAGKPVIKVTEGEDEFTATQYIHASGEVIWQITAEEPVLSEAVGALP
jgi:hypothetical protein